MTERRDEGATVRARASKEKHVMRRQDQMCKQSNLEVADVFNRSFAFKSPCRYIRYQ